MRPARERVELLQFFFRVAMPGFSVNYGRSFGSVCRAEDQDREHGSEHLPILERLDRGEDTPRPDMYQLYRAADRTSPPAPVIAQAGRTRGLKLIVHPPSRSRRKHGGHTSVAGRECDSVPRNRANSEERSGAPSLTRTGGLRFRKPSLYPPELWGRTLRC